MSRPLLLLTLCVALTGLPRAQSPTKPLTNADVIAMVKAGLPADIITAKIGSSATDFDTSPSALAKLRTAGVPDAVMLKMIAPTAAQASTGRIIDPITRLFRARKGSVVTVWSEIGQGTGFIIDSSGLILTNQHVIGPSTYIAVQSDPEHKVAARLLAADPDRDVAVLWADIAALPGVSVAPLAPTVSPAPVLVGEEVFTIGSPMGVQKILTTGIVSKIEAHAIFSNININHGNSGGPLFNSQGHAVGITTFLDANEPNGPGISGIILLDQAQSVIQRAKQVMAGEVPPSGALLPVAPADPFPLDALKADAAQPKFDARPYFFSEGKFDVYIITPPLKFWASEQGSLEAARGNRRRNRKSAAAVAINPLNDLRNWRQYLGDYDATIEIRANPQLRQTFLSALSRGLAAAGNDYNLPPERLHYVTDFLKMRLLCGDREVAPITPAEIASLVNVHNPFVNVSDATYQGFYIYPPDAISPECGDVKLELYSQKDPDHPTVKKLSKKTVQRIWSDFAPFRAVGSGIP